MLRAAEADETRQFRSVAARAYDDFRYERTAAASAAAAARDLGPAIAAFRARVDP
jgi:hypothetical protein